MGIRIGTIIMTCMRCRSRPGDPCKYKGEPLKNGKFHDVRIKDAKLASDYLDEDWDGGGTNSRTLLARSKTTKR